MELLFRHAWLFLLITGLVFPLQAWKRARERIQNRSELESGYRSLIRGYLILTNLPWVAMGLLVLSGRVPGTFTFLMPKAGNVWVLAWWALVIALIGLGAYWFFLGDGAEILERHPGLPMVPPWPAAKLRKWGLGILALQSLATLFFFLDFPSDPEQDAFPYWLLILFPVFFVGMWYLVGHTLSALGGWSTLAESYETEAPLPDHRIGASAKLNEVNYSGCLTLGADSQGLYMKIFPPFVGHPPLFIPWSDIEARETSGFLWRGVELQFSKTPMNSARISRSAAKKIFGRPDVPVIVKPEI